MCRRAQARSSPPAILPLRESHTGPWSPHHLYAKGYQIGTPSPNSPTSSKPTYCNCLLDISYLGVKTGIWKVAWLKQKCWFLPQTASALVSPTPVDNATQARSQFQFFPFPRCSSNPTHKLFPAVGPLSSPTATLSPASKLLWSLDWMCSPSEALKNLPDSLLVSTFVPIPLLGKKRGWGDILNAK